MPNSSEINVTALLFGQAREWAGSSSINLVIETPATVERAFEKLRSMHPRLGEMQRSLLFAVNEEYAGLDHPLADGDTIAVLPPVSGGETSKRDIFEIIREPIQIEHL